MALQMAISWTISTHDLEKLTTGPRSFVWFVPHAFGNGWGNDRERNREPKMDSCRRRSPPLGSVLDGLHGELLLLMDGWKLSCQD